MLLIDLGTIGKRRGDHCMVGSNLTPDRNNPRETFSGYSRASTLLGESANPESTGFMKPLEAREAINRFTIISRMPAAESLRHSYSVKIRKSSLLSVSF